jgi:hypothetical protein
MASEAYNLVAYGVFEAQHHTDGYYHHRQSYGDACRSYTDSGETNFLLVSAVAIDASCYE